MLDLIAERKIAELERLAGLDGYYEKVLKKLG